MYFYDLIKNIAIENDILMFVDMDGVIASYDAGKPLDFANKRPLMENIKKLEMILEIPNVELNILSICKRDSQIEDKNNWLDKYAPFFDKKNRIIISKENLEGITSPEIKANFLKTVKTDKQIVLIDDDNLVLKKVMEIAKNVIVFQDSELID